MEILSWIAAGLAWFLALPTVLKLMALVGIVTPLAVLHRYLFPAPVKPRPGDIEIVMPDGKRAQGYIKGGDTYLVKKK